MLGKLGCLAKKEKQNKNILLKFLNVIFLVFFFLPFLLLCFDSCPVGASCSGDFVTFADIVARGGYRRLSWNARYGGRS